MPDDQSNETEQIMGAGYQPSRNPNPSPQPSGDEYSQMLGESGGNPVSRWATRVLAAKSGAAMEAARQRHQQRIHEQDILFNLAGTAAEQGMPLSPEAQKYYKSIGGDPQLLDVVGQYGQQKQQQYQQDDQRTLKMLGLNPEDVGMAPGAGGGGGAPAAGAGGGGGGSTPSPGSPSPTGATPASTGGGPGPNAGKHWGDPSFDWKYYTDNEPPELKAQDRQMRILTYQLDSAARRGKQTAGIQAQLKALQEQHHAMLESYLGFAKQGEQHQFAEQQQERGQTFQKEQQGRGQTFQKEQQERSFTHADALAELKKGSPEEQRQAANEMYTQFKAEKEDIKAGLANGTLNEGQAVAKLNVLKEKVAKLDKAEEKAKRAPQGPKLGLLEQHVESGSGMFGTGVGPTYHAGGKVVPDLVGKSTKFKDGQHKLPDGTIATVKAGKIASVE